MDRIAELKAEMEAAHEVYREAAVAWKAAVAETSEFKVGDRVLFRGKPAVITAIFERWGKPAYRVVKIKNDGTRYQSDQEAWGSIAAAPQPA